MRGSLHLLEGWGYREGTTALSDYMTWCMGERAKAKGAARIMYKLLGNSLIGKFAQRSDRVNLSSLFKLADASKIGIDELADMSYAEQKALGDEFGIPMERFSLGPVWMPEWNGLITGYVRAQLSRALWKCGGVYCHTDSLWTRDGSRLDPKIWELKASGRVTVVRTRFAALWGKEPHVAHHSVWTKKVAEQMIRKFTGTDFKRRYPKSRPLKFREALKKNDRVGRWIEEGDSGYWHSADTRWDGKRCLLPDGTTRPWTDLKEYLAWKEANG